MPRKKMKQEIRKPDFFQTTFRLVLEWSKGHRTACIGAAVALVLVVLAVWGYAAYRTGENEKAQYALFEGMNSFRAYTVDPKSDGLSKAEGSFEKVAGESSGGLRDIARLYLAKIAAIKGMKEQAGRLYAEINKKPANDVIKKLSEIGLQESGKKE
ncbi:MAG: hypothetical protein ABSB94_18895 [Syntrophorhabdales bacterium]|jgi:hypothetical protein